jgi:hypothetical protein
MMVSLVKRISIGLSTAGTNGSRIEKRQSMEKATSAYLAA